MTRTLARLVPVLILLFSLAAFAQSATPAAPAAAAPAGATASGPGKIGIVNIRGAIVSTNEGQRDFQALQAKFSPKRNELETLNREVEDLKNQLSKTGDKLNQDARDNLLRQIDTKQKSLNRALEDAQNDFGAQENEIANRIAQKLAEVLDKYAKQNGYALIFDTSGQSSPVIWADVNSVDVTQALVDAYNAATGVSAPPKTPGSAAAPAPKPAPAKPAPAKPAGKPAQ